MERIPRIEKMIKEIVTFYGPKNIMFLSIRKGFVEFLHELVQLRLDTKFTVG